MRHGQTLPGSFACAILLLLSCADAATGQAQSRGGSRTTPNPCDPPGQRDHLIVCHREIESRREIALGAHETLRVTVLDANPLVYSYGVTGEPFTEDQSARDAFRRLFALRDVQTGAGLAQVSDGDCRTGTGLSAVEKFECFTEALASTAILITEQIRISDTEEYKTPAQGKAVADRIRANLAAIPPAVLSFITSETTLSAELAARYQALGASPTAVQQAQNNAAREAIPGIARFWRELQQLTLGPRTFVYNFAGTRDEVIRLHIQNRLGDPYQPTRVVTRTGEGIAIARAKPRHGGFEFTTGLGFVAGERVSYSLEKVPADSFRVVADTARDLSVPPSLFLSYLWPVRGPTVFGVTAGAGIKDLSQIDDTTDLLGGVTLGHEWFRLTIGAAFTSEIRTLPGLSATNRTADENILNRASRDRVWRFAVAVHGRF